MVDIANVSGGFSSDGDVVGRINASSELDLTGQNDVRTVFSALHQRFNGHLCSWVKGKASINDGVRNGIAQLVRVACRHGF